MQASIRHGNKRIPARTTGLLPILIFENISNIRNDYSWYDSKIKTGLFGNFYVGRSRSFLTIRNFEIDLFALTEVFVTCPLDVAIMDKNVSAAIRWRDKSKTFGLIKPFYSTLHFYNLNFYTK